MHRRAILPLAVALIGSISGMVVPAPSLAASPPSETATASPSARQLVLNRRQRLLTVMEGEREVRRFRVGVGMPGWETPVGSFSVIEKTAYPIWEHPAKGVRIPRAPPIPSVRAGSVSTVTARGGAVSTARSIWR